MARSVIVDVRKAVIQGISEALDDEQVSCSYGWQGGGDDARREQIYTNRPRATHRPASLKAGRTFRNESMEFDVVVLVYDPTKPPEEVDERLMELGQVVEEFIADSKSVTALGVAGLNWLIVTGLEIENRLADTGAISLAQYTVTYDARLT